MSVAYFKERLKNANEINAERKEMREIEKVEQMVWDQSFASLERWLERDETIRGTGDQLRPETRMKRSIDKIAKMEQQRLGLDDFADWTTNDVRLLETKPIQMWAGSSRISDLRDNYIYQLFGQNVLRGGAIRTYSQFSMFFGMRAVVRLLAEVHGGETLLAEIEPDKAVTAARQDALNLYRHPQGIQDQMDIEIKHDDNTHPLNVVSDPFELMDMMRDWIPGIEALAESLLIAYSDAVRMERQRCEVAGLRYHDGTLPDDPTDGVPMLRLIELWPEPLRIEQACLTYAENPEMTYREVAKTFRIPIGRFHSILTERNLVRKRGQYQQRDAA